MLIYTSTPPYACMAHFLIKRRDNLRFITYYVIDLIFPISFSTFAGPYNEFLKAKVKDIPLLGRGGPYEMV
jgi:hypothetical protein